MRYLLTAIAISAFIVSPVSASLVVTGVGGTAVNGIDNDFYEELEDLGLDMVYNGGADITATIAGTLSFFYHAAESGFTNTFHVGSSSETEGNEGWSSDTGTFIGSIAIGAGQSFSELNIYFSNSDNATLSYAGSSGFGVFYNNASGSATVELLDNRIFIGYDDNGANPEDNHDDMIVSVVFTPVPEASTIAVWSILASIGGVAAYKKRKAVAA